MKPNEIFINMLGEICITYNDTNITNLFSNKSLALICYMLCEKESSFSRQKLSNLLWGDSKDKAARYNLRYNLWSINKILSYEDIHFFIGNLDKVSINTNTFKIHTDINYLQLLSDNTDISSNTEKIISLYKGSFLDSFYLKGCYDYNDWIFFKREQYQKIYYESLIKAEKEYNCIGKYQNAIKVLQLLISINPFDERLYLKIIKNLLLNGNKTQALQYYNRCVKILREELNISPCKELIELKKQINNFSIKTAINKNVSKVIYDSFCIVEYDLLKDIMTLNKDSIVLNCLPIKNLKFGGICELLDQILPLIDIYLSYNTDIYHLLQPLSTINPLLKTRLHSQKANINYDIYEITIHHSLLNLLNKLQEKQDIVILIKSCDNLDLESYNFIKYVAFNYTKIEFSIYIANRPPSKRIENILDILDGEA